MELPCLTILMSLKIDLTPLWADLQFKPTDAELFLAAITHRSYGHPHNERLEFLGDSVLSIVISQILYEKFPAAEEGTLTRLRSHLVRKESLAQLAHGLQLGKYIRLGLGERKSGGSHRDSILADALEAILGAIFLEAGFDTVFKVIQHVFSEVLATLNLSDSYQDAKTRLQEYLQAKKQNLPQYELVSMESTLATEHFVVSCKVPSCDIVFTGEGPSRKIAEQRAARAALSHLL